jgi:hypothetical protein
MTVKYETGFRHLSADEYHADPCQVPALSSSIANILDSESPMHAHARHPRLGGLQREPTKSLDAGSLAHTLLLGAGKDVVLVDAKDYRTKAAQEKRDAARDKGMLPVLEHEYKEARAVADLLRERFADFGIALDGEKEITALWTETASNGGLVQCRGMMDLLRLRGPQVLDLKSARSAKPDMCRKHVENYGYAIQRAAYVSAVERIHPELTGRVDFLFVFFELEAPYAVTPIRLNGAFREIGTTAWRRAVDRWEACLRTNKWPAYTDQIIDLEPSNWAMAKSTERALDEAA